MAENIAKAKQKPENIRKKATNTINAFFEAFSEIDTSIDTGQATRYVPHVLLLSLLAILYIANAHQSEKMVRKINKLEVEVENMRADYITLKVEFMSLGKQSEISKRAQALGLGQEQGSVKRITLQTEK